MKKICGKSCLIRNSIPYIYPYADHDFYPMKEVDGSYRFVSIATDNDDLHN